MTTLVSILAWPQRAAWFLGTLVPFSQAQPQAECLAVREALEGIAAGRVDMAPLRVTYDDLHSFWGGLRLTIRGTGQVEQTAVREKVGEPQRVSREDLVKLAALLVKHAAWEQRVPERAAVPDETKASLTIRYGPNSVTIWEWHNDLEKNRRIGSIGDFMQTIAWKKPARGS